MKNLFGKPRPDLIDRCKPDLENLARYIVGGIANITSNGQLVSADICTQQDRSKLDDGFRSYPSGHSSTSAAGLIYLSLFIASKFTITIPFLAPAGYGDANAFTAFPSRANSRQPTGTLGGEAYELMETPGSGMHNGPAKNEALSMPGDPGTHRRLAAHNRTVAAVRLQAAAPPLYLLLICILPFFASVFIAGSRWFDFRHHGFDILFGYLIGVATSFFAFRYYHLPIRQGAGWAWGPRSHDKAFWGGVGSYSYATTRGTHPLRAGDEEEALGHSGNGHAPVAAQMGYGPPVSAPRSRVGTDRSEHAMRHPRPDEMDGERM
jgi:membrane-associated phospholipid phosphatase